MLNPVIVVVAGTVVADDEFDMFAQTRSSTFADSRKGFVFIMTCCVQ